MRLWTIQPKTILEIIEEKGQFRCNPKQSELLTEYSSTYKPAYNWLVAHMRRRIGRPPVGIKYPIWAWHTFDGKHRKPDLRKAEFKNYSEPMVCIEIEIPDKQVLLSDEEDWHVVLNNIYFADAESGEDFDLEHAWFDSLPRQEQKEIKQKSWEKIFKITSQNRYVQATFWELRKEQIISVTPMKPKKVKTVYKPRTDVQ